MFQPIVMYVPSSFSTPDFTVISHPCVTNARLFPLASISPSMIMFQPSSTMNVAVSENTAPVGIRRLSPPLTTYTLLIPL